MYKSVPDFFMQTGFSDRTKRKTKNAEIPVMQLNSDPIPTTTKLPDCMKIHKLQQTVSQYEYLQHLKDHIIQDWPENRD